MHSGIARALTLYLHVDYIIGAYNLGIVKEITFVAKRVTNASHRISIKKSIFGGQIRDQEAAVQWIF